MKRFMIFFVIALAAVTTTVASPSLDATTSATDPTPITPGDTATIYVTIENTGSDRAESVTVDWEGHRLFSLLKPGDEQRTQNLLGSYEDVTLAYDVTVADDAPTGSFDIPLKIRAQNTGVLETSVDVEIKPDRPTLQVNGVSTAPDPLAPGQQGRVGLTVANKGERPLSDVDVAMNVAETPFLTVGQTNTERIDKVLAGETREVDFQVTTKPSTESGIYNVPFTITFTDTNGDTEEKTVKTGVKIGGDAELLVTLGDSDISTAQRSGEISLNVVNRGLSNVKLLQARLQNHSSYDLESTESYYVGDVESDDFDVITFTATASNDTLQIPVELAYRTAFNAEQTTIQTVTYELPEGSTQTSYTPYILALVVILGAVWWYKRR